MTDDRTRLRAELAEAISEISEGIDFTSWGADVEHRAWELVDVARPDLSRCLMVTQDDVDLARRLRDALGEWPEPGTVGERFIPIAEFSILHREWQEAERVRLEDLEKEEERRRVRDLDDADLEVLRSIADHGTAGLDALARYDQIRNLNAKGLLERAGSSWIPKGISEKGREHLAGSSPRI